MKTFLKDVAEIKFCLASRVNSNQSHKVLVPINLLENNVIDKIIFDSKTKADESTKIKPQDIIVKRISPSFINFIDSIDDDVYASGNLIIITAKNIEPKFLAYILNKSVPRITKSLVGATIPAINRSDLEEIQIPVLPIEKQKTIGELWYKGIELYKLKNQLNDLELAKNKSILIDAITGGN